jgi:protoheme IX farnesyltransferase
MIAALLRLPLCGAVAGSALIGYLAAGGAPDPRAVWLGVGVLLAAAGATVLNQWQERHSDTLMERTRHRPLASGRLAPATGLGLGLVLAMAGFLSLASLDKRCALLTAGIYLLYHGVYTPMKRLTMLALLPGALCGALPPIIGWLAGGGDLRDPRPALFTGLLLLWQIPHSWHILLRCREDLHRAGLFPELHRLPSTRLRQLILVWIAALSTATLSIPAIIMPGSGITRWLFAGSAAWPLIALVLHHREQNRPHVAGWQSTGVLFLGTVMGLFLWY